MVTRPDDPDPERGEALAAGLTMLMLYRTFRAKGRGVTVAEAKEFFDKQLRPELRPGIELTEQSIGDYFEGLVNNSADGLAQAAKKMFAFEDGILSLTPSGLKTAEIVVRRSAIAAEHASRFELSDEDLLEMWRSEDHDGVGT